MRDKVRGVEHELAMNTGPPLPHGSLVHLVGMAIEELKQAGLVTSIRVEEPQLDFMALNGFRVYNDMSHLELSSPSYNTPLEAVVYDRVAELFAYYAASGLRRFFRVLNVYKNNVSNVKEGGGWRAVSYSTHSSILMDRRVCNPGVWGRLEEALVPFMVTRIMLTGGGDYVPCRGGGLPRPGKVMKGDGLRFVISPRAAFVKRVSSNDTVDARGLLNQRDDPHADPSRYWRLHDINWEGLRSPYQVYLRDCLETMVMTAYEGGFLRNPPRLADPVSAIKELTLDTEECNWKVSLEGGGNADAVAEILEGFYLAGIEEMMSRQDPAEEDRAAFRLVEATLRGLGERRLEYFIDGIDWVTKKALVDEYAGDDADEALGVVNQFTLIDDAVTEYIGGEPAETQTTFSYGDALEFARDAIPHLDWDGLSGLVARALREGPTGTRDYLRCLVAREFPFLVESIEWERINFHNAVIRLDEPFMFNKEMCGDQLEKATATFNDFTTALDTLNRAGGHMVYTPTDDHEKRDTEEMS